jgi:hypothetical protein
LLGEFVAPNRRSGESAVIAPMPFFSVPLGAMPISQCTSHQPGRPFVSAAAALATGVRTGIKWLSGNDILFF